MRVSVVVTNLDYEQWVGGAIDSALAQQHDDVEVVVVDDGSRDRSRDVIRAYGDAIVPLFQPNGGQAAALNAGIRRATGDAVILLDADDVLAPTAAATAARELADPSVARVQWPLTVIDEGGHPVGEVAHAALDAGDVSARVLTDGPFGYGWAITSGNAWSGDALRAVTPIPEDVFRTSPDIYLSTLVPLHGEVRVVASQSSWRRHGRNHSRFTRTFDERLDDDVARFEACRRALRRDAATGGRRLDEDAWEERAWFLRLARAVDVVDVSLPPGEDLLLVDDDAWAVEGRMRGRTVHPFLADAGRYAGPPGDDDHALRELARVRASGIRHVAIAWTSTWWLDAYPRFARVLTDEAVAVTTTPDVVVHTLTPPETRRVSGVTTPPRGPR